MQLQPPWAKAQSTHNQQASACTKACTHAISTTTKPAKIPANKPQAR
jgi:hypothetical protein